MSTPPSTPNAEPRKPCCEAAARGRKAYLCDGCGLLNLDITPTPSQTKYILADKRHVWGVGPQGEGKCMGLNTPILLHDGSVKLVQDILVGDRLMGPDSQPRTVLSLARGREEMFRVTPVKGEPFICNRSHILSLQRSGSTNRKPDRKRGQIVNIAVSEYLHTSATFRLHHLLYRRGVEFPARPVNLDPYWLGLWLGDGTGIRPEITTADEEVVEYLNQLAVHHHCRIRVTAQSGNRSSIYTMVGQDGHANVFYRHLRGYALLGKKHIPRDYKAIARTARLQLLAGLIDSDGWVNRAGYQLIFKSRELADDVVSLARGLGFASYIKESVRQIRSRGFTGTYYRLSIDGDCSHIPVRIKRKQVPARKQKKNVLMVGIKAVESLGLGDYYGFTLAEDPFFLLGDFTVMHNTFTSVLAILYHRTQQPTEYDPLTHAPLPQRWAFIRDTHQNLKHITIPAIKKAFPGVFHFKDADHLAIAPGLEIDLFGMDRVDDLGKIQGAEYDGIHLEEPAPIIAQGPSGPIVNAGMSREVFTVCATRIRGGQSKKRLQIAMNPADKSHWTYYERELNPQWEDCTAIVHFTPGENPHISVEDREAVRRAFADRPDLFARYVLGKESEVYAGVAITPSYNSEWHKAGIQLDPIRGAENFLFFDGGLNPTCVLAQLTPSGRLHLLDCVSLGNQGMRQMITVKLIPLLNSNRWKAIQHFRALGDDSLRNREQSDSDFSAASIINTLLKPWLKNNAYEGGVQDWDLRRESIHTLLEQNVGGIARLLVNPITTAGEPWHRIHAALAGGYCYKITAGIVQRDGPDKNVHSHVGDAITHAVARLFESPTVREERTDVTKQQKRAVGYAVGGLYLPRQGAYG